MNRVLIREIDALIEAAREELAEFCVLCMLSDENGNVLVQNRNDPSWPGICFPGGHVEKGESFTAAAIREVQQMKQDPTLGKSYTDVDEMMKELLA